MAKRLTDANKWQKSFFSQLPNDAKLAWIYLLDSCDHAGIWSINYKLMSFHLAQEINKDVLVNWFGDKLIFVEDDNILISSFVEFQYGNLNLENRVHKSVIIRLEKLGAIKALNRAIGACKDKDKDKDKEKDKEKEEINFSEQNTKWFSDFVIKEMQTLDTGLILYAPKVSKAFSGEKGFRDWLGGVISTKKFKEADPDQQIRYFKASLSSELKARGVM